MFRRRPRKEKSSKKTKNQSLRRYLTEWLEPRKYLVVLHGGDNFEFFQNNTQMVRVVVEGITTVEVIGAHVPQSTNGGVVGGLAPFPAPVPLDTMNGVITAGPDAKLGTQVTYPGGIS